MKMKNGDKHFLVFIGLVAICLILFLVSKTMIANGALPGLDVNTDAGSFSLDSLTSFLFAPIDYLANTVKHVADWFMGGVMHLNIMNLGANNAFSGLNDWFLRTTGGISLIQVLSFAGNTIASIFIFLADVIQKGVSAL